jgi:thioredoxin 1
MALQRLCDLTFYNHIGHIEGLVVVEFSATRCGPCQILEPVIEKLAKEMEGEVRFFMMNVVDSIRVTQRYEIRSIPTLAFFLGEEKVGSITGAKPKEVVREAIDEALAEVAQRA